MSYSERGFYIIVSNTFKLDIAHKKTDCRFLGSPLFNLNENDIAQGQLLLCKVISGFSVRHLFYRFFSLITC